ncbi:MAG: hypothetical protein AAF318_15345 [Pseudomonadota bacterium]
MIIPGLAVGVGAFIVLTRDEAPPVTQRAPEPLAVRAVDVTPTAVAGRAEGFGRVRATRRFEGVSEVEGRVTALADTLTEGAFITAGTVYARIDQRDYEIAKARAAAALESARASLAEIAAREDAARANLVLEERVEALAAADLERKRSLVERGTNAQITVDQSERDLVNQTRRVQELKNELALYAVQRVSAEASIASSTVDLEEAERNLESTVLRVPFDARVVSETLEVGEYVRPGDSLVELDDVAAADITVEVQPAALRAMFSVGAGDATAAPIAFTDPDAFDAFIARVGLTATVHLGFSGADVTWPGRPLRTDGSIDETTGTVGVIVRVDDPYGAVDGRGGPPLTVGAFVRVVFETRAVAGRITVPREAVRRAADGAAFVYVALPDDTLGRRAVTLSAPVNGAIIVEAGLEAGDRVVLSRPQPPILGMPLTPIIDRVAVAAQ